MARVRIICLKLGIVKAYVLQGAGSSVLVDSGYQNQSLETALAAAGSPELRAVLITHAHTDHFGGLKGLVARRPGLAILAGAGDAESLARGTNALGPGIRPFGIKGAVLTRLAAGSSKPVESLPATRLLRGGEDLAEYGVDARVVATPGHSPGSVSLFVPEGVDEAGRDLGPAAIIGDLAMGGFVLAPLPSPPLFASGWEELRASMSKLKDLGVRTYLTGHGGPLKPQALYRRYGL